MSTTYNEQFSLYFLIRRKRDPVYIYAINI